MKPMEPEATPIRRRSVPGCVLRIMAAVTLVFLLLLLPLAVGIHVFPELIFALAAGWFLHAARVVPDFFAQWHAVVLPAAALALAWWTGHRLIRWWLASRSSALANVWTMGRSAMLLGMLLLCGAAAIAVSGVAHQMMWLGKTKWTQSNRRSEVTRMISDIRQCGLVLMEFEEERGRLPHSWDEVLRGDEERDYSHLILHMIRRHALPVMTHPGADTHDMNPGTILLISEEAEGRHALGLADGAVRSVTRRQLDAILASGEMLCIKPR